MHSFVSLLARPWLNGGLVAQRIILSTYSEIIPIVPSHASNN